MTERIDWLLTQLLVPEIGEDLGPSASSFAARMFTTPMTLDDELTLLATASRLLFESWIRAGMSPYLAEERATCWAEIVLHKGTQPAVDQWTKSRHRPAGRSAAAPRPPAEQEEAMTQNERLQQIRKLVREWWNWEVGFRDKQIAQGVPVQRWPPTLGLLLVNSGLTREELEDPRRRRGEELTGEAQRIFDEARREVDEP